MLLLLSVGDGDLGLVLPVFLLLPVETNAEGHYVLILVPWSEELGSKPFDNHDIKLHPLLF